jgi:hypothetical protein
VSFPVLWFMPDDVEREADASPHRLCWDQWQVEQMLTDLGGHHRLWEDDKLVDAAVVVIPAGRYEPDFVQAELDRLDACVVILTSDETAVFDSSKLTHGNARWWVQAPRPGRSYPEGARFLPCGFPPFTSELARAAPASASHRDRDWAFLGQVNHRSRRELVANLRGLTGGDLRPSQGFTTGVSQTAYMRAMAAAKIAPCPSGPGMADSFRVWEALEAGCVPVVEEGCPAYKGGYWGQLGTPFPTVGDWSEFPALLPRLLDEWPGNANRIQSWWSQYRRSLEWGLWDDWNAVTGQHPPPHGNVTVIMPTSPIPSHPDTSIIEQTVATVRHHLPDAELIITADGVRAEQAHYRPAYDEYLRRLTWLAAHEFGRCTLIVHDQHQHQANMTRHALELVRTPTILFVEHDTPLCADEHIDWAACEQAIASGVVNTVRFHFESVIPDVHKYLMIDWVPKKIAGLSCIRTRQWSQRPHLSSTVYYRRMLADPAWFPPDAVTMIEDVLNSPVSHQRWERHKVVIYAPRGGHLKRSWNLDGRGADEKFEMQYGTRVEA